MIDNFEAYTLTFYRLVETFGQRRRFIYRTLTVFSFYPEFQTCLSGLANKTDVCNQSASFVIHILNPDLQIYCQRLILTQCSLQKIKGTYSCRWLLTISNVIACVSIILPESKRPGETCMLALLCIIIDFMLCRLRRLWLSLEWLILFYYQATDNFSCSKKVRIKVCL